MSESGKNELDELYQATIVDHERAPRHAGSLSDATHQATFDNPLCGDVVSVQARIVDGTIEAIAHDGHGCALSRAAASIMSTMVCGRTLADVQQLAASFERCINSPPDAAIAAELGELRAFAGVRRFRSRRICALLPFRALQRATDDARK